MAFSSEQMWNELGEFLYNSFLPNIAYKSGSALRFVVATSRFVLFLKFIRCSAECAFIRSFINWFSCRFISSLIRSFLRSTCSKPSTQQTRGESSDSFHTYSCCPIVPVRTKKVGRITQLPSLWFLYHFSSIDSHDLLEYWNKAGLRIDEGIAVLKVILYIG